MGAGRKAAPSQTFSTVPALPSVRITALPTSSVSACSLRGRLPSFEYFHRFPLNLLTAMLGGVANPAPLIGSKPLTEGAPWTTTRINQPSRR
jgi:hypothetical protein